MNNSGLIDEKGNKIMIPYYEIGNMSEKIVRDFISENNDNKELFELFKKDYSYFNPCFDFIICCLGYKFVNPFILDNTILKSENGHIIDESKENDKVKVAYPRCTDENLNIGNVDIDNLKDCIISPIGIKYETNRDIGLCHEQLFEILLVQKMIYSKELYDDYIKCRTNNECQSIYYNINAYFRDRLGYAQVVKYEDKTGYVLFNNALKDNYFENLFNSIQDFYPKIELIPSQLPENMIEKSQQMKENIGEQYESRRI